jgi:hypothetical protein
MKRILLIVGLVVVAASAYYGYREWNRDLVQAEDTKADVTLKAEELFQAFVTDEVNVLLETGDALGAVVCEFEPGTAVDLKKDAQVTIKGFCAGYNLDVLLQRCAIVE